MGEGRLRFISCIASREKCHLSFSFSLSFLGISLPSFPPSFWGIRNSHASISLAVMCPRGTGATRGHPGLSCKGHIRPWEELPYAVLPPKTPEMAIMAALTLHPGSQRFSLFMRVKKHGQGPDSISEGQKREPREALPHQKVLQSSRCHGT